MKDDATGKAFLNINPLKENEQLLPEGKNNL
jgi:hypothetical protein